MIGTPAKSKAVIGDFAVSTLGLWVYGKRGNLCPCYSGHLWSPVVPPGEEDYIEGIVVLVGRAAEPQVAL